MTTAGKMKTVVSELTGVDLIDTYFVIPVSPPSCGMTREN
jgi:hypothetical protein